MVCVQETQLASAAKRMADSIKGSAMAVLVGGMKQAVHVQTARLLRAVLLWASAARHATTGTISDEGITELVARFSEEQRRLYCVVVEGWSKISLQRCVMLWLRNANEAVLKAARGKLSGMMSNAQLKLVTTVAVAVEIGAALGMGQK